MSVDKPEMVAHTHRQEFQIQQGQQLQIADWVYELVGSIIAVMLHRVCEEPVDEKSERSGWCASFVKKPEDGVGV